MSQINPKIKDCLAKLTCFVGHQLHHLNVSIPVIDENNQKSEKQYQNLSSSHSHCFTIPLKQLGYDEEHTVPIHDIFKKAL